MYIFVLDKRNTAWLCDAVRQTSLGKSADLRSALRPLTSLGTSAWPYHVTTQDSYCMSEYVKIGMSWQLSEYLTLPVDSICLRSIEVEWVMYKHASEPAIGVIWFGALCVTDLWYITSNPLNLGNVYRSCGLIQHYFLPNDSVRYELWRVFFVRSKSHLFPALLIVMSYAVFCYNSIVIKRFGDACSMVKNIVPNDLRSQDISRFAGLPPFSLFPEEVLILKMGALTLESPWFHKFFTRSRSSAWRHQAIPCTNVD